MEDLLPYYQNYVSDIEYYATKNIYDLTLAKNEFAELKTSQQDVIIKGALPHQKFMARFMSPYTPYDRMLVYHELGTGKCVHPETKIFVDGELTEIKNLWSQYLIFDSKDKDGGEWKDVSHLNMKTLSYVMQNNTFNNNKILRLYRQYVREHIVIYTTENTSLICTKKHRLFTHNGWENDVPTGTEIAHKDGKMHKIISKRYVLYDGYVYDLEVENTHNYVADGLVTHNTCLMSNVVEFAQSHGMNQKALILVRSDTQKKNILKEISKNCFPDKYKLDAKFLELEEDKVIRRLNKLVSKNYDIRTFYTFAKELKQLKKEAIVELYSNRYIFVDEAHRLREKDIDNKEKVDVYKELFDFFHSIKNCKIMLMTGTPMKDKASEICSIMNLLLPLDNQMDENDLFINENPLVEKINKYLYGIVSFVSQLKSSVKVVYEGDVAPNMKNIKTYRLKMSEYQSEDYMSSFEKERKDRDIELEEEEEEEEEGRKSLYKESRQKSLFVYNEKIELKENNGYYFLKDKLRNEIKSLEDLKQYSAVYHFVLNQILNSSNEKIFVFGNIVRNTGINLLGALLSHLGYTPLIIGENFDMKRFFNEPMNNRYAVLSGSVSDKIISKTVDVFNHPSNIEGKYLKVIIGSSKISEGLSLKEVRKCFITTPFWNNTETEQSIGRVLRSFSHDKLPLEKRTVDIYRLASLPNDNMDDSIDMIRYKLSEDKDIKIKEVEKLLKQNAIDCELNKGRNNLEFGCKNVSSLKQEIIYDTYNLFFADEKIEEISQTISSLFQTRFVIDLETIKTHIDANELIIVRTLNDMINNNIPVVNANGALSFIREDRNLYFLVDDPKIPSVFTNAYYTNYPVFSKSENFPDFIKLLNYDTLDERLEILVKSDNQYIIDKILDTFDNIIMQKLICMVYITREESNFKTWFMQKYGRFIVKAKYTYCFYIYNDTDKLEDLVYLKDGEWSKVGEEEINAFSEYKDNIIKYMKKNNPYEYYGVPDDKDETNFKLVLIEKEKVTKKGEVMKKISTGLACGTGALSVPKVVFYYLLFGKISEEVGNKKPYPILNIDQTKAFTTVMNKLKTADEIRKAITSEKAWKSKFETKIQKFTEEYNKTHEKKFSFDIENVRDEEELRRIYMIILYNDMKINLCPGLKMWFNEIGYFSNL
jgi:hypothetical protein